MVKEKFSKLFKFSNVTLFHLSEIEFDFRKIEFHLSGILFHLIKIQFHLSGNQFYSSEIMLIFIYVKIVITCLFHLSGI